MEQEEIQRRLESLEAKQQRHIENQEKFRQESRKQTGHAVDAGKL